MSHVVSLALSRETISFGGTAGPYIWGKENSTPGGCGSQGNPEWLGGGVGSLRGLRRHLGFYRSAGRPAPPRTLILAGPESSLSFFGTAEAVPSRKAHERGRSRLHLPSLTPSTSLGQARAAVPTWVLRVVARGRDWALGDPRRMTSSSVIACSWLRLRCPLFDSNCVARSGAADRSVRPTPAKSFVASARGGARLRGIVPSGLACRRRSDRSGGFCWG